MEQPQRRREKPSALHPTLPAPRNLLSRALIPRQTHGQCRAAELSAASPSTAPSEAPCHARPGRLSRLRRAFPAHSSARFSPAINPPTQCCPRNRPAARRRGGPATERHKNKAQEKQQNPPGAAWPGFFTAPRLGGAIPARALHPGHARSPAQSQTAAEHRPLPGAAAAGAVKNGGFSRLQLNTQVPPPSAGLENPQTSTKASGHRPPTYPGVWVVIKPHRKSTSTRSLEKDFFLPVGIGGFGMGEVTAEVFLQPMQKKLIAF